MQQLITNVVCGQSDSPTRSPCKLPVPIAIVVELGARRVEGGSLREISLYHLLNEFDGLSVYTLGCTTTMVTSV